MGLPQDFQAGVWKTAPLDRLRYDPYFAVELWETWQSLDTEATVGDYVLTQATTGTAAISTAAPGVLELDSNSSTSTQGAQIQRVKSCWVPAANKSIWAEFRVKVVDTFDKVELFVGLSEIDTTIIAASAVSPSNFIGWQCVTDDGVLLFASEKATVGTTQASATIAEDTYIRLGFYYSGTNDTLQQYVNGVATGAAIATANIPKVALFPSFVCQSAGTNDPILHVAQYRIIQLA
jgi:hypothetical protein